MRDGLPDLAAIGGVALVEPSGHDQELDLVRLLDPLAPAQTRRKQLIVN
jgi:hypothetical protein